MSLFLRLVLIHASVTTVAVAVMIWTPVTLSYPFSPAEDVWLVLGAFAMLAVTALVIWRSLRPLATLTDAMYVVDSPHPAGRVRLPMSAGREVTALTESFNRMLDRLDDERAQVARATLLGQEDERRRIARELHDEVGQSLTVALLHLSQVSSRLDSAPPTPWLPPQDRLGLSENVQATTEAVRGSLEIVRDITSRLRPPVLDDLGLIQALTALISDVGKSAREVRLRRELDDAVGVQVSPELALVVYRVAQEALTNVVRHAGARQVSVVLRVTDGRLLLEVNDDGCGAGAATRLGVTGAVKEGNGLTGMRERARLVNGRLSLLTADAARLGGTTVRLEVPLG